MLQLVSGIQEILSDRQLGLPFQVVEGDAGPRPVLSRLRADDAGTTASVVDLLHALGHRRIVHVAGLPSLAHTERRVRSPRIEAGRRGLAEARSLTADHSDIRGAAVTRRVPARSGAPTALIYDNAVMAAAGAAVTAEFGLSVPGDVSVVAFEDSALCRLERPRPTALSRDAVGSAGSRRGSRPRRSTTASRAPYRCRCPR